MPNSEHDKPHYASLSSVIVIVLFMIFIFGPLTATMVNIARGPTGDLTELRTPTPRWPSSLHELVKWPGAFRWYFAERFGLKEPLRRLCGHVLVNGMKTSSSSAVILGKNDFMFLASEGILDYRRGANPLTSELLDDWVRTLAERHASLAERGTRYGFMVAPDSHSVYQEELPENLTGSTLPTRLDQFIEHATRNAPQVPFIDLRSTLLPAKATLPLYFKNDTHWNPAAAWLAASELARRLDLPQPPGALLPVRGPVTSGGDLARLVGLGPDLEEAELWPAASPLALTDESGQPTTWTLKDVVPRTHVVVINENGKGTAVIFRDSFGEALIPWISGMFRRTHWVFSYEYAQQLVDEERPQVVLEQIVERRLMTLRRPGGGVNP